MPVKKELKRQLHRLFSEINSNLKKNYNCFKTQDLLHNLAQYFNDQDFIKEQLIWQKIAKINLTREMYDALNRPQNGMPLNFHSAPVPDFQIPKYETGRGFQRIMGEVLTLWEASGIFLEEKYIKYNKYSHYGDRNGMAESYIEVYRKQMQEIALEFCQKENLEKKLGLDKIELE